MDTSKATICRGITFIPLVIIGLYFYSQWYLPDVSNEGKADFDSADKEIFSFADYEEEGPPSLKKSNSTSSGKSASLLEKELDTGVDAYITGWLTVSREYFIYPNGGPKNSMSPPSSASNDASISQSETAYSSLYKLMSNNSSSKSLKGSNSPIGLPSETNLSNSSQGQDKKQKKSTSKLNKHGNLFLYQDSDQSSVKHVIVIANHVVTMWPPNVNDGQLFIKRSAICLAKINYDKPDHAAQLSDPENPPTNAFYLFSDNCSEKEDFYFALIRASKRSATWNPRANTGYKFSETPVFDPFIMAQPLHYKTSEIMELIQTLHSTDANLQTRWLNALLGRLFLAVKDTHPFEHFFRNKIVNKLARVKRPTFLSDIEVKKIYCGHAIPYFTNPKLRELTPEGLMVLEANVSYTGSFSIEIATKAILNLGARFKPRDVSLNLSVAVQHIEGKLIFKIKPPPSNRLWYAFETMPKLNLLIEPIVSSKQITYNVVTKAIENRIREVFKETLVLPYMDDLTFFGTEGEFYRGGIWDKSVRPFHGAPERTPSSKCDTKSGGSSSASVKSEKVDNGSMAGESTATSLPRSKSLRHRNTAAMEMPSNPSGMVGPDLDSVIPPELGDRSADMRRDSNASSSDTTSNSEQEFDLKQHIGELKGISNSDHQLEGSSPPQNTMSKPAALVGTVKKWSSWYFKERLGKNESTTDFGAKDNHNGEDNIPTDDHKRSTSRSSNEACRSGDQSKNIGPPPLPTRPKPAPEPHHFPPELMNSLNETGDRVIKSSNPYAPTPEMKLPENYAIPAGPSKSTIRQPSPVSMSESFASLETIPGASNNSNKPPKTFARRKPVGGSSAPSVLDASAPTSNSDNSSDTQAATVSTPDLSAYPPVRDPMAELASSTPASSSRIPPVNVPTEGSQEGIVLQEKNKYTVAATPENAESKM
ncbi:hypothetical protein TRICI_000479 [Trichomonascus ciferrii]|uniref:SMP-LTD domain-containing protein n=1 Tax=Trichomonascus ciferrii TaxID=44093 RepID=A0A642VDA9_9ASCO|nr:hypothetical protein TRICI_000479 [Trichomonascus ciferrii]